MNNSNLIYAFLSGAFVGAIAAMLFAPEKGSDLRAHIQDRLKHQGIDIHNSEIDALIERLKAEIDK